MWTFYALLGEMEDMFRIQAVHKQLDFLFERDDKVPRFIRTDSVKLRQVLINLLNNAFKFTERGAVTLRVDVGENDEDSLNGESLSPRLIFEVEDTGCGINPFELTRIFDAFEQAEAGRSAKEGTGLGLTISRNFVQLMGGHLSGGKRGGQRVLISIRYLFQSGSGRGIGNHGTISQGGGPETGTTPPPDSGGG